MYRYSDEVTARACHAVAEILKEAQGDEGPSVPFAWLPAAEQEIVIAGVRAARAGVTPRELFERWAAAKRAAGWTWGPERDPELKTHPNLVDYRDLPPAERDKDRVFLAIVTALTCTEV
jgi:RyR domain